jgi:uncharacterized membrane-anchored protein
MTMRLFHFALIYFALTCQVFAEVQEQSIAEIKKMDWKTPTNIQLPVSGAIITNLPGYVMVLAKDARRLQELSDGQLLQSIEGVAVDPDTSSSVVFQWIPDGYVASDDWSQVDPNEFLAQIQKNDLAANVKRKQLGIPTVSATGWRQTPKLNSNTHTVSWVIDGQSSDGSHIINAVAMKLGRYGYEKIIWVDDPTKIGSRNDLLVAANAFEFKQGARYDDYEAGTDKAAEYGVAGLVAGALGVKLLKAAGGVALLVAAKKFGFLLLVMPFIWIWNKIKSLFGGKAKESDAPVVAPRVDPPLPPARYHHDD